MSMFQSSPTEYQVAFMNRLGIEEGDLLDCDKNAATRLIDLRKPVLDAFVNANKWGQGFATAKQRKYYKDLCAKLGEGTPEMDFDKARYFAMKALYRLLLHSKLRNDAACRCPSPKWTA